jgi:Domain of unknown function (DUF4091)
LKMEINRAFSVCRRVSIIGLFAAVLSASSACSQLAPLCVWTTTSLERVGPKDASRSPERPPHLFAARAEWESFQVIVHANATLTNVSFSFSDLAGPLGAVIPKSSLSLYRESYIFVTSSPDWRGTNRPLGSGWYPDGLIPFAPGETLTVSPDQNQPIWVDLFVPADATPGSYTGSLRIKSDQGRSAIPISLKVWNFTLPAQPSLKSSVSLHGAQTMQTQVQELLLQHKLMPAVVNPTDSANLSSQFGLSTAGLLFWSNDDAKACTMASPPAVSALRKSLSAYPPSVTTYVYVADEIGRCTNLFGTIKQWALALHEAGSKSLLTIVPQPGLYSDGGTSGKSAVDFWVMLPSQYVASLAQIPEVINLGNEIWSYTALVQDSYSPKWLVDFSPLNFRITGFIAEPLGVTGILYWSADHWNSDPWHDLSFTSDGENYPGEGQLIYPGLPVGVSGALPSIRLKWLRDGVEDYEYVEILKGLGRGPWALQTASRAAKDWTNWTQDPATLESVREQLGAEIDYLMTSGKN